MSLITLSQLEEACSKGQGYADDIGEAAASAIDAVLETASQAYSLAESAGKTATDYLSYDEDTGLAVGYGSSILTVSASGCVVTATTFVGDLTGTADYASALKVSAAIGGTKKPVYINSSGVPTALSSTVGSGTKPIYLSSGTLTVSSSTVGTGTKPIYLSSGTLTVSSSTVGDSSTPVFLSSGTITECSSIAAATADALTTTSVGDSSTPVYIDSSGVPQECDLDTYMENIVYLVTTTYYVYYSKTYYYCDYSSFSYSSLSDVAAYYGATYNSYTTLATNSMTIGSKTVKVSLLSVTATEEGEDSTFTITVLTNGTGYSIDISTSTTKP